MVQMAMRGQRVRDQMETMVMTDQMEMEKAVLMARMEKMEIIGDDDHDGADAVNGADSEDGDDGHDGADGEDGADGNRG